MKLANKINKYKCFRKCFLMPQNSNGFEKYKLSNGL